MVLLFLPLYLQASAWQAGFGQEGWYSAAGTGEPWLSGWNAAVWVHTLAAIPWVVLFAGLGLRTVEAALGRTGPARWNPVAGILPRHVAGMLAGLWALRQFG